MNEFGSKIQQTRPKTNLTKQANSTLDTGNRDKNVDEKSRELPNLQVRKKLSLPFNNIPTEIEMYFYKYLIIPLSQLAPEVVENSVIYWLLCENTKTV